MASYGFAFSNPLVNTGFVLVGSGLSKGQWGPGYPAGLPYLSPSLNSTVAGVVNTTGEGTEGYFRLYPTLDHKTSVPSNIPDDQTLYIGWNISEAGVATFTLTAPSVFKLSSEANNGPLSFAVIGDYGADTCQIGYVWREAYTGDHVCVLPATRAEAAADNQAAASRRDPQGPNGPMSCKAGYVWREARAGDEVCVTTATRSQVTADNAAAASRVL